MLGIAGWILVVLAWVVIVVDAFKRHTLDGLLCLFIPFYGLFHLFFRQQTYKGLAILLLVGGIGLRVAASGNYFGGSSPCDLADKAEVGEAFGERFETAESTSARGGEVCQYKTSGSPANVLTVGLVTDCAMGSVMDMSETRTRFRVSDVGDAAMSSGPDLYVQKGTTCVVIRYSGAGADSQSSLPARKRVAQRLLTKVK